MDAIIPKDDSVTQPDTLSIYDELLVLHQKILHERGGIPLDDDLIERVRDEREAEIFAAIGVDLPTTLSEEGNA